MSGHAPAAEAENVESGVSIDQDCAPRPPKKIKLDESPAHDHLRQISTDRKRGFAAVKAEFLVDPFAGRPKTEHIGPAAHESRDDAAEEAGKGTAKRKKNKGQNTQRHFGSSRDALALCMSRAHVNEFAPSTCNFGDKCKYEHNLRKYLHHGKREDLSTFDGNCPVYDAKGTCDAGWRCRFASAHSEERETEDGRKELVLLQRNTDGQSTQFDETGVVNVVPAETKISLRKREIPTPKSDPYADWLQRMSRESEGSSKPEEREDGEDHRASYVEQPFLPSEKRRLYYGPETPVLAPLTTQGNLPFRRLCIDLGAQLTWSEMAMSQPLVSGDKSEWALMRAHESETTPPKYNPAVPIADYDHASDLKFGAQLAGNKPPLTLKATEVLTKLCPSLRAIDLNCGCPIDLVFRTGAGSALMDTPGKLEKILRGMNAVSGEIPVTVKIRMGTKDNRPTADKLIDRLAFGGVEAKQWDLGPCGVAAITLHGRSRQQRYTRSADWGYIASCAATVKRYNEQFDKRLDTIHEVDPRHLSRSKSSESRLYFVGNGDCYSHEDYNSHIASAGVDSVMVARGALMKPWVFEEIEAGQHLDKSAAERLGYIEKFARYGLQTWGSDEIGVGTTRRFLLEWLSFACRYVPVGILEHLPPHIQERPPAYRGRSDLETLLSSDNYKDWIKISEMFLGPAHKDFRFEPKHKSNSYEIEAEG